MNTNYTRHRLASRQRGFINYDGLAGAFLLFLLCVAVAGWALIEGARWLWSYIGSHLHWIACAVLAVGLTACGPTRPVVKSIAVEVPREVRVPVDPALLQPCTLAEPDAACWDGTARVFCNGQLATMRQQYREALRLCTADKVAIRTAGAGK